MNRFIFRLAILSTCLATLGLVPAAHATFPGNPGLIAFHTNRNGNYDIYVLTSPSPTQLTTNAADDQLPAWSADGQKIAFVSTRDGNAEIYTMNADGSVQTRITNNPAQDTQPTWSPDGTKIAFVSNRDGNFEIYTMNADGSGVSRITTNTAFDSQPNWSPDGTKIAFQSDRTGNFDIYKMNPDGTSQVDLTNNSATDEAPNYTADDARIYFDSNRTGQYEVYFMNSFDGSSVIQRTSGAGSLDWNPAPIPAPGSSVEFAWQSNADGPDYDIWLMGAGPQDLTGNTADDGAPDIQALNSAYPRPKGATPLRLSFVQALKKCGDPGGGAGNTLHKGSISTNSCWEPKPESNYLTVGTPDYNGQVANSIGSARFDAKQTPTADGSISVSYSDVRCQGSSGGCSNGALSDYTDDLYFDSTWRITDKGNGPLSSGPSTNGTVDDITLRFSVPCATTAATSVGSTCSVATTIDSLLGSTAIAANRRAVWQLVGGVNLWDGGADGLGATMNDDTLFAVAGLFFP